jgi:TolB protein
MLRLFQIFGVTFGIYLIIQTGIGIYSRHEDSAGSWIAFLSNRDADGNGDIYRMFPDGSAVQRLTHTLHTECNIQWSGDGRWLQIIYVEPQFVNYPYCNKIHFEYGRLDYMRRIPQSIPIGISELSVSPDGRYIAYADATSHLYRIHTDDHSTVQLTDSGHVDYYPVWSPDGQWIAFQSLRGRGYVEFYRMDAATGEIFQLTDYLFGFVNGIAPSWSPDSQWITFWVEDRLFKVPVDGGRPILLMNAVGSVRTPPLWSPDGQSIAFIASSIADTLYVIPSGGGQPQALTFRRIDSRSMSWSPDSEWLVYQTLRGEDIELYKIRRDGTDMQQLTDVPDAVSHNPIWSPAIRLNWQAVSLGFIAIATVFIPTASVLFTRRHQQVVM